MMNHLYLADIERKRAALRNQEQNEHNKWIRKLIEQERQEALVSLDNLTNPNPISRTNPLTRKAKG